MTHASGVRSLILPRSRLHIEWRPDDHHWRALDEDVADALQSPATQDLETGWSPWTGGDDVGVHSRLQSGVYEKATGWWVLFGEQPSDASEPDKARVSVELADGTSVTVQRVGFVWACEWVSSPQDATVRLGNRMLVVPLSDAGRMVAGPRYK